MLAGYVRYEETEVIAEMRSMVDSVGSSTYDLIHRKSKSTSSEDFEFGLCYALLCSGRWHTYTYVFT